MSSRSRQAESPATSEVREETRPDPIEALAGRVLGMPLTLVVVGICLCLLAAWIPNYLDWPWWIDASEFCFLAQQWDRGVDLPYRDLLCFNFPGEIYLHWVLGRSFGWGNTRAFYAVDVGFVVVLGGALIAWSRRLFGRALPGAMAYLSFLGYYLSQGYEIVAQRDWHAGFFAVLALLVVESRPGRPGRLVSALLLAMGLSIRPQVILLMPAFLCAIDEATRRPGDSWHATLGAILEWGLGLAACLGLVFLPLVATGLWRDFLWGAWGPRLVMPGGTYYGQNGLAALQLLKFFSQVDLTVLIVVLLGMLLTATRPKPRGTFLTWLIALGCVMLYRPLSPQMLFHKYLDYPLRLVISVQFAIVADALLVVPSIERRPRLVASLLLIALAMPSQPTFVDKLKYWPMAQLRRRGPAEVPTSYIPSLNDTAVGHYDWFDYQALLEHLRRTTPPERRVANLLYYTPAVLGNVPRPSVFPTPALNWAKVAPSYVETYAKRLERATDSVVVWAPSESNLGHGLYDPLRVVIERYYAFETRFGEIEVWRRNSP